MPLVIYSNAAALNAQHSLDRVESGMAVSLRRLASGLRVSSARDDAAGLAISERMASQVRGSNQAIRNVNDGISLLQTLDGFAGQLNDNLQRLREVAVQAANGTNSASDRLALDREIQLGLQELDRAATNLSFNGRRVADGSYGTVNFQIGADAGQTLDMGLSTSFKRADLGALETLTSSDLRTIGAFTFDNTYTTGAIGTLDFSRVNRAFVGGSASTAGAPTSDYSGANAAVISVDGINVTLDANYASLNGVRNAIQTQLNSSNNGEYVVALGGAGLLVTKTANAANATAAVVMGAVSGAAAAVFAGGAQSTGVSASTASQAGFSVGGRAVYLSADHSGDGVGGLIADIQQQLDALPAKPGVYAVSGDASGISIVKVGDVTAPVIGGFTGIGAAVFAAAPADTLTLAAGDFSVQLGTGTAFDVTGSFATAEALAAAINAQAPGVSAAMDRNTGELELLSTQKITLSGAQAGGILGFGSLTSSAGGSLANANVLDAKNARATLIRIDATLDAINSARATYGAAQNRMASVVDNLRVYSANMDAARGRLVDADYARETAHLTRQKILQQASIALLSQANLIPRMVLSLLRL
jgi:flagellin